MHDFTYFFTPEYFSNSLDLDVILIFRLCPNHTCEIIEIESKIKRKGYGSIIYKEFEQFIKNKYNVKNIYAFIKFTNEIAIEWYKKMNFSVTVIPNYYFDELENKAIILTKNI